MKAAILSTLVLLSAWANAAQIYGEANLTKISSEFGFKNASNVHLMVIADKDNNPTSMELSWDQLDSETGESTEESQILVVHTVKETAEGRTIFANLPQKPDSHHEGPVTGPRFNVQLIDYSDSPLYIYHENVWKVNVSRGYGWCGTGDSRMELVGNPL